MTNSRIFMGFDPKNKMMRRTHKNLWVSTLKYCNDSKYVYVYVYSTGVHISVMVTSILRKFVGSERKEKECQRVPGMD